MKGQSPPTVVNHTAQVLGTNFTFSSRVETTFNSEPSLQSPNRSVPVLVKHSFFFFVSEKVVFLPESALPCYQ